MRRLTPPTDRISSVLLAETGPAADEVPPVIKDMFREVGPSAAVGLHRMSGAGTPPRPAAAFHRAFCVPPGASRIGVYEAGSLTRPNGRHDGQVEATSYALHHHTARLQLARPLGRAMKVPETLPGSGGSPTQALPQASLSHR